MKRLFFVMMIGFSALRISAQDSTAVETNSRLTIGGYGHVDYNQPLSGDTRNNGKLDVHRVVLLFNYNFSDKLNLVTELELEHVSEVYVEQAYLGYKVLPNLELRAGLMLIPFGIINEYHEPPTFFGVERPLVDNTIIPTTWREIGFGVSGNIQSVGLKYQFYLVNGFNGYDGSGKFSGSGGFRKGRQKGAESYISSPNISMRVEHLTTPSLKIGLSGYFGDSQSTLFNKISKDDAAAEAKADSSVVNIAMVGADYQFKYKRFQSRALVAYANIGNTEQYNQFAGTDLGSAMLGWYVEAGYRVLDFKAAGHDISLSPFARIERINTHFSTTGNLTAKDSYDLTALFAGFSLHLSKQAVFKTDLELRKTAADSEYSKILNIGVGFMF